MEVVPIGIARVHVLEIIDGLVKDGFFDALHTYHALELFQIRHDLPQDDDIKVFVEL
jgi:hypothetical protein